MTLEEVRRRSAGLLGTAYRAEIAHAIAVGGGEPVTAQPLADFTSVPYPRVVDELHRLVELGLLSRIEGQERQRFYKPVPSAYWRLAAAVFNELVHDSESDEHSGRL